MVNTRSVSSGLWTLVAEARAAGSTARATDAKHMVPTLLTRHGAIEDEFESCVDRAGRIELRRPPGNEHSRDGVWQKLREGNSYHRDMHAYL